MDGSGTGMPSSTTMGIILIAVFSVVIPVVVIVYWKLFHLNARGRAEMHRNWTNYSNGGPK